jgi:radical SAM protein with 4Fe4S-binding SPASM domain
MLPVSELIEVATSEGGDDELRSRAPQRFSEIGRHAPVVIWNVCMHCNMACPHCVRVVIFSGGEPLLRSDLIELIAYADSLGISPQLSSNGVLIDAAMAGRLAEAGVRYAGVSIDGLPDFNDDYRGLDGGHEAALEGLRNAKRAGMKTGLRMTLSRRNVAQLPAMLEVAEGADVDRFYVSHLVYSGRGYQVAHEDLRRDEVRGALLDLFERAEKLVSEGRGPKVVTGSNDSDGVLLLQWIVGRYGEAAGKKVRELLLQRGGNSAGERVLDIDSSGRVHPDQFWRQAVLGDVRKQSFAGILQNPLREQLRRRVELLKGRCGACSERALCRGSHRERALAIHRDQWGPDPACVMEDAEIGITNHEAMGAESE